MWFRHQKETCYVGILFFSYGISLHLHTTHCWMHEFRLRADLWLWKGSFEKITTCGKSLPSQSKLKISGKSKTLITNHYNTSLYTHLTSYTDDSVSVSTGTIKVVLLKISVLSVKVSMLSLVCTSDTRDDLNICRAVKLWSKFYFCFKSRVFLSCVSLCSWIPPSVRCSPAIMSSTVLILRSTCWMRPTSVLVCRLRTLLRRMAVNMLQISAWHVTSQWDSNSTMQPMLSASWMMKFISRSNSPPTSWRTGRRGEGHGKGREPMLRKADSGSVRLWGGGGAVEEKWERVMKQVGGEREQKERMI